jgi:hypothetical protein
VYVKAPRLPRTRPKDESGESYLDPAARFEHLALPPRIARALAR